MSARFTITPFRIVLLFIIATATGLLVLPELSVDWLPVEKKKQLNISFSQYGSSPDIIEQQVTSVLEGALSQLPQLKKITSASYYNTGNIALYFDRHVHPGLKQVEVAALIRRIYPQLPANTSYPIITAGGSAQKNNAPFLVYVIHGPQQAFQVKAEAENVFKKALAAVPGISQVMVSGAEDLQIIVEYDINKCKAWNIEPAAIGNALREHASAFYPGSVVSGQGETYFLRILPGVTNLHDVENILLSNAPGRHIRLKDLARVFIEERNPRAYFRVNGRNSVRLTITAREGENKLALAEQVKALVNNKRLQLPAGYNVHAEYDDTKFLQKELNRNYQRTTLSIAILIGFILLAYRSWRYLLVLFSGLVVNISLTAVLAFLFNVNIHLYTIAGLAISFGLMTDNAIVMIDYYHRHRNRSFFMALLGATLTTIAALCLIFLLPAEDRSNLSDFAMVIVLALASSMMVALWFTPGLYDLLFRRKPVIKRSLNTYQQLKRKRRWINAYFNFIQFAGRYRKTTIALVMLLFGLPVFMLPEKLEGDNWYHRWYNGTIGSTVYQESIRPHADKWLGGTLHLFTKNIYERAGYRDPEKTKLSITAELPYGNTAEQVNNILIEFEKYLSSVKGIDKYVTNVYSGQSGSIEISFKEDYEHSLLPYQLKSRLIARSLEWGGVEWSIQGVGQGFNNAGMDEIPGFRIKMKGYNYDELKKQADKLASRLQKHKRVQKVNANDRLEYGEKQSQEYVLQMDEAKMALQSTNRAGILQQVNALSEPVAAQQQLVLNNRFYDVMFKASQSDQYSSYDLLNVPLQLDLNKQVRIKDLGEMVMQPTTSSIHKEDRQYIRALSFEYMGAVHFGEQFLADVLEEMKQTMPVGYTAEKDEWTWSWKQNNYRYFLVALLVLAIFFICSILFENLKQPVYIISMIPLSFVGLFLVFAGGNFYFDQGGYAAFVMLGGLVANAAIYIVNDFNNLKKNKPVGLHNQLLIKAVVNRARTIVFTVIATCCGLIPFLVEGQNEVFWFALAAGTIAGLLFSVFGVFVVLPVMLWKRRKTSFSQKTSIFKQP